MHGAMLSIRPRRAEAAMVTPEIHRVADAAALYAAAAAVFVRVAADAIRAAGAFTVVLSGGSTPRGLYAQLAGDPGVRAAVEWEKVHVFWGDERHVPPDHADSNYRMAHEALLGRVPVDPSHVWRIKGEYADASGAAEEYDRNLRGIFRLARGEMPRFDLVLLGMGSDGHTASLFPATTALGERRRLAVSNWVGKLCADRITLTVPVFNNASCVMFLVEGSEKATALKAVFEKQFEPEQLPAQLIRPHRGRLLWFVDRAAATLLAPTTVTERAV
jgi:6-phosphogluconolactonase